MNDLITLPNGLTGSEKYLRPPEEEGLINKTLPIEVFDNIMSFVDKESYPNTARVSRTWNQVTMYQAQYKEGFITLKKAINFFLNNLDSERYEKEIYNLELLQEILINYMETEMNPSALNSSIKKFEQEHQIILKNVDFDDIISLQKETKIEEISSLYKEIIAISPKIYHESLCGKCLQVYDIEQGNECVYLACGHIFHRNCVEEFLITNESCPTCKERTIVPLPQVSITKNYNSILTLLKFLKPDFIPRTKLEVRFSVSLLAFWSLLLIAHVSLTMSSKNPSFSYLQIFGYFSFFLLCLLVSSNRYAAIYKYVFNQCTGPKIQFINYVPRNHQQ